MRFHVKRKNGMVALFLALSLSACKSFPAVEKTKALPVTLNGSMANVCLALVQRQNVIHNEDRTYSHPDGLEFYFVIYPNTENHAASEEEPAQAAGALIPTIKEAQQFTIDGKPYWQNIAGSIDSRTVIYTARTFAQDEPETAAKLNLAESPGAFVQKTIICGEPLPSDGNVRYLFNFGFDQKLEEFEFLFRLKEAL